MKLTEIERQRLIAEAKKVRENAPKLDPNSEAGRHLLDKWRRDSKSWHAGMFTKPE